MKAVILGKASSRRVPLKNYKEFYKGNCLVDILLEKLVRVLPKEDIYLSCEEIEYKSLADKWDINFIHRDRKYTLLDTNTVEVVRGVCKDVPGDDDILYCSGMDPLFDDYENILQMWEEVRNTCDSLNVIYPKKAFFLDQNHNPIGFGFGVWHKYSQFIPPTYQISWANAILRRDSIERVGYMVGENPYWYDAYNPLLDIDTEEDWELAKAVYSYYHEKDSDTKWNNQ